MKPSSRTPEGEPNLCPICGKSLRLDPSRPPGDAPCPHCGSLVWFDSGVAPGGSPSLAGVHQFTISGAHQKAQALRMVLDRLVEVRALSAHQRLRVFGGLMRREQLGSTAIGRGGALPHTSMSGLQEPITAIAEFPGGISFGAADGQPVTRLCLLISPRKVVGDNLRHMLERAAQLLREE